MTNEKNIYLKKTGNKYWYCNLMIVVISQEIIVPKRKNYFIEKRLKERLPGWLTCILKNDPELWG